MAGQFNFVIVLVVAALCVAIINCGPTVRGDEKAVKLNTSTKAPEQDVCIGPCGWAVYTRFTRRIDYFVGNPQCKCPVNTKCSRYYDDVSVSAYVYSCKPIPPKPTS